MAGLNVPADSHPLPRGAITGASDTRCHAPNGEVPFSCAAKLTSSANSAPILRTERFTYATPLSPGRRFLLTAKNGRADPLPFPQSQKSFFPDYFLFTDFFSSAPGLNFATLRAAILMVAPVCGLRPLRAFFCETENGAKPINATPSPLRR